MFSSDGDTTTVLVGLQNEANAKESKVSKLSRYFGMQIFIRFVQRLTGFDIIRKWFGFLLPMPGEERLHHFQVNVSH